jgi:hypothetical protein
LNQILAVISTLDEEESFQLALAMSQSEAEEKERQKKMLTQKYAMSSFLSAPANDPPPVRLKQPRRTISISSL